MAPTTGSAKFVHKGWAEISGYGQTKEHLPGENNEPDQGFPVRLRPPPGRAAEIAMTSAAYWQARHSS
jgi:hypothetical protein